MCTVCCCVLQVCCSVLWVMSHQYIRHKYMSHDEMCHSMHETWHTLHITTVAAHITIVAAHFPLNTKIWEIHTCMSQATECLSHGTQYDLRDSNILLTPIHETYMYESWHLTNETRHTKLPQRQDTSFRKPWAEHSVFSFHISGTFRCARTPAAKVPTIPESSFQTMAVLQRDKQWLSTDRRNQHVIKRLCFSTTRPRNLLICSSHSSIYLQPPTICTLCLLYIYMLILCLYMCIYIYVYIYMYTYIYVHIYITYIHIYMIGAAATVLLLLLFIQVYCSS